MGFLEWLKSLVGGGQEGSDSPADEVESQAESALGAVKDSVVDGLIEGKRGDQATTLSTDVTERGSAAAKRSGAGTIRTPVQAVRAAARASALLGPIGFANDVMQTANVIGENAAAIGANHANIVGGMRELEEIAREQELKQEYRHWVQNTQSVQLLGPDGQPLISDTNSFLRAWVYRWDPDVAKATIGQLDLFVELHPDWEEHARRTRPGYDAWLRLCGADPLPTRTLWDSIREMFQSLRTKPAALGGLLVLLLALLTTGVFILVGYDPEIVVSEAEADESEPLAGDPREGGIERDDAAFDWDARLVSACLRTDGRIEEKDWFFGSGEWASTEQEWYGSLTLEAVFEGIPDSARVYGFPLVVSRWHANERASISERMLEPLLGWFTAYTHRPADGGAPEQTHGHLLEGGVLRASRTWEYTPPEQWADRPRNHIARRMESYGLDASEISSEWKLVGLILVPGDHEGPSMDAPPIAQFGRAVHEHELGELTWRSLRTEIDQQLLDQRTAGQAVPLTAPEDVLDEALEVTVASPSARVGVCS